MDGYIEKYGNIEGKKRYDQRCEKIGKTSTLLGYIDKYGEIEGLKKWENYKTKLSHSNSVNGYIDKYGTNLGIEKYNDRIKKQTTHNYIRGRSKISESIGKILDILQLSYIPEYHINYKHLTYYADYYIKEFNLIIEFFGDYYHCNPNIYNSDYYNKRLKCTANEIWEKDKIRLNNIQNSIKDVTILKIWESTKITDEYLYKIISDIKGKNTIFEI